MAAVLAIRARMVADFFVIVVFHEFSFAICFRLRAKACICKRVRERCVRLGRALPQRSLPPCGGGTGRGVSTRTASVSCRSEVCERDDPLARCLVANPSPCPSPTRGEGTLGRGPSPLTQCVR